MDTKSILDLSFAWLSDPVHAAYVLAIFAALCPRPTNTDSVLGKIWAVIDVVSANWGNAKNAAKMLIVAVVLGVTLSACSTAETDVSAANSAIAANSQYLTDACAAFNVAITGTEFVDGVDGASAAVKAAVAKVQADTTGTGGLCSPAVIANPPTNVTALLTALWAQAAAFVKMPTLPVPAS